MIMQVKDTKLILKVIWTLNDIIYRLLFFC